MKRFENVIHAGSVLLAAGSFGLAMTFSATAADEGEALFDAECAACHGPRNVAGWAAQYRDKDERRDWLDRFLRRHYPPADDERALIIEHIEALIAER